MNMYVAKAASPTGTFPDLHAHLLFLISCLFVALSFDEMASVDTKPKKKRIAPQKEAELPIVSVPEDIIAARRLDDLPVKLPSTAGIAKGGIEINIRSNPMVNVEQARDPHHPFTDFNALLLRRLKKRV